MKEIEVKIKFESISAITIFFISLFFISCQKEKDTYKVEKINGVKVIQNLRPKWGDKPKIELEFVRKIGGTEVNDERYIFYRPFDLVQDKHENKYILSWDDYRLKKYGLDWEYVLSFGRVGQGPGEILRSFGCAIDEHSNIYVVDSRNMKVHIFSSDGEFQKSAKIPFRSNGCGVLSSGRLILSRTGGVIDKEDSTMLAMIDLKGEVLKEFVNCQRYDEPDLIFYANTVNFDIDDEDCIYVTFENQNRIEKYSPDGNPLLYTSRHLNHKVEHKMDKETYQFPEPILTFVSVDIRVDNKGRIWVTTFDRQPESQGTRSATLRDHKRLKFEIFDKDGVLLGEVPVPIEFYKKRIYGDTLYLIDPYFEACIYEYKIIEK